jgi:glycosyltransferase involved in cell wall biosynthesis
VDADPRSEPTVAPFQTPAVPPGGEPEATRLDDATASEAPVPAPSNRRLSVVLPAHDEEANIADVLAHAGSAAERLTADHEIVVVDDGSRDATAEIVRQAASHDPRIRLVSHERNRGYGEALRTGFRSATHELVVLTDADGQFDLAELEAFLPWIERVHVVCGYRKNRQDPWVRRLFAAGWNSLVRVLFFVPVRDIDCAFKLFRRSVFDELDLEAVGAMVSTELMVKLGRSGAGVVEVGVTHYPRTAGSARGADPRVIVRALRELVAMRRKLRHAEPTRVVGPGSW